MRRRTWEAAWRAHLQVPEAELAAEQLVLLPHVLLQVPEEAEGRPLGTAGALVLQQLPGETPGQPPRTLSATGPREHEDPHPTDTLGVSARRAGAPTAASDSAGPGPRAQGTAPHLEDGGYPQDDHTPHGVFPLQVKNLTHTSSGAPHRSPEFPRHTPHFRRAR